MASRRRIARGLSASCIDGRVRRRVRRLRLQPLGVGGAASGNSSGSSSSAGGSKRGVAPKDLASILVLATTMGRRGIFRALSARGSRRRVGRGVIVGGEVCPAAGPPALPALLYVAGPRPMFINNDPLLAALSWRSGMEHV